MATTINSGVIRRPGHNPVYSYGGNYYTFVSGPGPDLEARKASTLSGTWTEQDSANEPAPGTRNVSTIQHGASNEIVSIVSNAANGDLYFFQFDMSADTWTTAKTATLHTGDGNTTQPSCSIACSNPTAAVGSAKLVIFFSGDTDRIMGGAKWRVDYIRSTDGGSNWGSITVADDAASSTDRHFFSPACVAGSQSDDVHFGMWMTANTADPPTAGTDIDARTLSGTTQSTLRTTSAPGSDEIRANLGMLSWDNAGTQRVLFYARDNTASRDLDHLRSDEDASNDLGAITDDSTNPTAGIGVSDESSHLSGVVDTDDTIYLVWSDTTNDIYMRSSTDAGLTFGDETEIFDAVTANHLSASIIGTDLVVVWTDGTGSYVDSYSLSSGVTREPGTASPSPTITGYAPTTVVANVTTPGIADPSPTITGYAPTSQLGVIVEPGIASPSPTITGYAPTAVVANLTTPDVATPSPTITGYAPEAVVANVVTPDVATPSPTITGYAPSLDRGAFPDKDDLVLGVAGSEPDAIVANVTTPDKDDLVLGVVGSEPIISVGFIVEPGTDALVLGVAPSAPDAVVANLTTPDVATPSPTITGYAPSLDRAAIPDKDDLVLGVAGSEPTAVVAHVVDSPAIDTLVLGVAGSEPTVTLDHTREPPTIGLVIDEKTPDRLQGFVIEPPLDELVLGVAGSNPTVVHDRLADVPLQTLDLGVAGSEPDAVVANVVTPGIADPSPIITGYSPSLDRAAIPDKDDLVLGVVGSDPTIVHDRVAAPDTVGLVIDEQSPSVQPVVNPGTGSLDFTTYAPRRGEIEVGTTELQFVYVIGLKLDGKPVTIDVTVGDITREPPTVSLTIDEKTPIPSVAHVVDSPAIDTLVLGVAGSEPTVVHDRLSDVPVGTLVIDEQDAFVSWIAEPDTVGLVIDEQQADRAVSGGDVTREPSTVGLAFSSDVITVLHDRVSIPSTIGLTIDGKQADRTVGQIREPATLGLVIAEQNADRSVANNVAPGTVALSITGYTLSLPGQSASIELGTGSLTFNGQDASIFYANGTLILNPDATTQVPTNYEICDYSGFRVMPGTLKWTWRRHGVRRKSYEERNPQEGMKGKIRHREATRGPRRPEQDDTFITTDVDPEDL